MGKATANWIGDQGIKFDAANSPLAEAGKIAAHGVTSGAIAEITGGKFAAGAAGGAMSELASNWSLGAFGGNEEYQVALNKVLGGLAAAAVTGDAADFDTGADRAETVYRYNLLDHQFNTMMAQAEQDRVKAGLGDADAKARVEAREQLSDAINNLTLDLLPVVGDVKGFVEAQDTLDYALAAIAVIPGGDLLKRPLKAAKEALKAGDVETANKLLSGVNEAVSTKFAPNATGVDGVASIAGKTCVYSCVIDGVTRYVGITDDIVKRGQAHLREKGIVITKIRGLEGLSRADARAVEQTLIDFHGLGKDSGSLINKINSISKIKNPTKYEQGLIRGAELLKNAGYEGF